MQDEALADEETHGLNVKEIMKDLWRASYLSCEDSLGALKASCRWLCSERTRRRGGWYWQREGEAREHRPRETS